MCKCRSHGTLSPLRPSKFSFEYLLLPPRSAPTAAPARARALGFAATAAPSYSSGPGPCPDGRVGTVTPASGSSRIASSAYQKWPTGALDSMATAQQRQPHRPTYLKTRPRAPAIPEGNFGGNQLLDGSISLSPLYPSQTNDLHVCSHSNPSQKVGVGRRCTHRGDPTNQLPCALRVFTHPLTRTPCQTPWSVFQDGPNGEPTGRRQEHARAEARPRAHAAIHNRHDDVSASISTARALGHRRNPHRVRAQRGSHLSGAPFQGTWARSATEDASPDYKFERQRRPILMRVAPPDLRSRYERLRDVYKMGHGVQNWQMHARNWSRAALIHHIITAHTLPRTQFFNQP
ncbi:hypothetical protein VNO78_35042 [Psophocarpus tetragonolobus]|uniref:Uncharacterized protein n=1 Tax=Psophocarpus tetragonolobus TaxID=3891 RepID=A0AAN9NNJ2_PSOTE